MKYNGYIEKNNFYSYPNAKAKRITENFEDIYYDYEGKEHKTLESAEQANLKWNLYARNPNNFPKPIILTIYYDYLGNEYDDYFTALGNNEIYKQEQLAYFTKEEKETFLEIKRR